MIFLKNALDSPIVFLHIPVQTETFGGVAQLGERRVRNA